jgi:hypothetical protein
VCFINLMMTKTSSAAQIAATSMEKATGINARLLNQSIVLRKAYKRLTIAATARLIYVATDEEPIPHTRLGNDSVSPMTLSTYCVHLIILHRYLVSY